MIRFAILLLTVIFPTSNLAQPSNIRAGEHKTFTRLVVDIKAGADWKIGRIADGYAVVIEDAAGFDFSGVFDRIPTDRVQSIRLAALETRFEIQTSCECHVSAFLWRPDKLVLDVNDGAPKSDSPFEISMVTDATEEKTLPLGLPIVTPRAVANNPQIIETYTTSDFAAIAEETEHLNALEEVVAQSLARGATQGLLTPADQLQQSNDQLPTAAKRPIDNHFNKNDHLGLLAHTSIDFGTGISIGAETNENCISGNYFDIATWASGKGFAEDVAPIRVALAKELDVVDFDEVTKLAKTLLFYGFGREAIAALDLDQEMSQERLILVNIGSVIDGDEIDPEFFSQLGACDESSALWAFLANSEDPKRPSDPNVILRSFRALPIVLQNHLGPRLGDMFTQVGNLDAALMVLSKESTGDSATTEFKLAEADLLVELGSVDEATATLANVVATDPRSTPEALSTFMTLALNAGDTILEGDLALADIMRFEHRGEAAIEQLVKVQARALIEAGEIDRALSLLTEEEETVSAEDLDELTSDVLLKAVETLPEQEFLDLAFSNMTDTASPNAQNAIAERLLEFGLAERANLLVRGPASGNEMSERRYLRAQSAIELDLAPLALADLEGVRTDRAELLREQATLMVASDVGNGDIAAGDDWRKGDWASLSESNDELLKSVSDSILERPVAEQAGNLTLTASQDLIAKSEESRSLIDGLLTRFAPFSE